MAPRPEVSGEKPVHLTLRLCKGTGSLRSKRLYPIVRKALRSVNARLGLRVVEHSVQQDHLRLMGEVASKNALSRGIRGSRFDWRRRSTRRSAACSAIATSSRC